MFSKITLDNFLSYSHIEFNLEKKGKPTPLAIIFGSNGIGKSDLCRSFLFLKELTQTMELFEFTNSFLSDPKFIESHQNKKDIIFEMLNDFQTGSEKLYQAYSMIDANGPTKLKYDFINDGKAGTYEIHLTKNGIIYENLTFALENNKVSCFLLTDKEVKINPSLFLKKEVYEEIKDQISKFWGKHSFFALLMHEFQTKSKDFLNESLHPSFDKLLDSLYSIGVRTESHKDISFGFHSSARPISLHNGTISINSEYKLDEITKLLNSFLPSVDSHYKDVFFKRKHHGKKVDYELYCNKIIGGKVRSIPFNSESRGIRKILSIIMTLPAVLQGKIIVIDELDTGIHESLLDYFISSLCKIIKDNNNGGQLIITAHSLDLLDPVCIDEEHTINRDYFYFILQNPDGYKEILSIKDFDSRTFKKNNIRINYLTGKKYNHGDYHSLPTMSTFDFETIYQHWVKALFESNDEEDEDEDDNSEEK